MNKSYQKKSKRLTVRMTVEQNNELKNKSKRVHMSESNYLLNLLNKSNKDNAYKSKMKPLNRDNILILDKYIAGLFNSVNEFRLDYARALANLEHDNDLYNHGRLQNIPRKTLETAKSALLKNRKGLKVMLHDLKIIEMNLYDN